MMERTPEDMLIREMSDAAGFVRSQCQHCKHFQVAGTYDGNGWTCAAFPQGIPIDMLALGGGVVSQHRQPVADQHGEAVYEGKTYTASTGAKYRINADWHAEVIG